VDRLLQRAGTAVTFDLSGSPNQKTWTNSFCLSVATALTGICSCGVLASAKAEPVRDEIWRRADDRRTILKVRRAAGRMSERSPPLPGTHSSGLQSRLFVTRAKRTPLNQYCRGISETDSM
jgi:hypothetical protein